MPYCGEGKQTSLKDKKLPPSHTHFMMHSSPSMHDCQNWDKCLASSVRQRKVSLHKLGGKRENTPKRNMVPSDRAGWVRRCCRSFWPLHCKLRGDSQSCPEQQSVTGELQHPRQVRTKLLFQLEMIKSPLDSDSTYALLQSPIGKVRWRAGMWWYEVKL